MCEIIDYTRGAFGVRQAEIYRSTLLEAIAASRMGRTRLEAWRGIKSFRVFGRFTSQGAGAMDVTSSFIARLPTKLACSTYCASSMTPWILPVTCRNPENRAAVARHFTAFAIASCSACEGEPKKAGSLSLPPSAP